MNTSYYKAPEVFRQNAIFVKKNRGAAAARNSDDKELALPRTCKADSSRLNSPLLRKVSGDLNDVVVTKKLRSDCWKLETDVTGVTSMSVDDSTIVLSNSAKTDNVHLYQLRDASQDDNNIAIAGKKLLHSLQTISVPGNPIVSTDIVPWQHNATVESFDSSVHDTIMLTGHSDGYVNMIATSTSEGKAKILKRFNHAKHLKVTHPISDSFGVDLASQVYDMHRSKPVRQLKSWNKNHFVSVINESLFVYDVNEHARNPLFLNNFPGLEHVDPNPVNKHTFSLAGTKFGAAGIALLDLRSNDTTGLRVPGGELQQQHQGTTECGRSYVSKWLDEYTVANSVGKTLKVWDIRYGEVKAQLLGHYGYVNSLKFDSKLNKLYSSDDQGLILSWDMNAVEFKDEVVCCRPSHGIQSFNLPSDCIQNGTIINSPDLERVSDKQYGLGSHFLGISGSNLLSLHDQELRSYSIVHMPMAIRAPPRSPLRLLRPKVSRKSTVSKATVSVGGSSSDETSKDSNSAFEDSEDTLEYEAHSPHTPVLDGTFGGKHFDFFIPELPLLSGIRRESDATLNSVTK